MKYWCFFILILVCVNVNAQYSFSGYVDDSRWQNTVYLSIVEDYRKISGVYSEQIISITKADSIGYFQFRGNQLDDAHRIYRIHVDNCEESEQNSNHFDGHCEDSKEVIFIAKNTDVIEFPVSFDNQTFCDIKSDNEKANAFIKIDSLKDEMRFAFTEVHSEANRKLNNKKWFKTLQNFGEQLNEPIAELYIYSFLSDRSNDLHDYYLKDLEQNPYYQNLENRLVEIYPKASYTQQYKSELASDRFLISEATDEQSFNWHYLIYGILALSLLGNILLWNSSRKKASNRLQNIKENLTKQEQKILDHLLNDLTNKEIAETMFVSVSTVKTHINNIYRKLNVQNRDAAKSLFNR